MQGQDLLHMVVQDPALREDIRVKYENVLLGRA